LIGGLAGVAALALGGSLAGIRYAGGRAAWVADVVRRNLPGVLIEEASIAAFVQDVLASGLLDSHKARLAVLADTTIPALRRIAPARKRMERLERLFLTEFLMGSNFFCAADTKSQPIVYSGRIPACGNPWATLSTRRRRFGHALADVSSRVTRARSAANASAG
jgi:hypothetical protein